LGTEVVHAHLDQARPSVEPQCDKTFLRGHDLPVVVTKIAAAITAVPTTMAIGIPMIGKYAPNPLKSRGLVKGRRNQTDSLQAWEAKRQHNAVAA